MADVHEPEVRSYNMSRIKGKDTKPELLVRKFLFSHGFRYRLNDKKLPGKPDIVLSKYRTVVFVNGCFWHGHKNCKYFKTPETRTEWWMNKINDTRERDKRKCEELNRLNWRVVTVWECELKNDKVEKTLTELLLYLNKVYE